MTRVDDFTPEVRAYPLYTRELIAAGTALLWHHPGADLADLVIERLAPGLDSIDVAATGRRSPTEAKDLSFMQVALARQVEERIKKKFKEFLKKELGDDFVTTQVLRR